jgi:protein SCO1
VTAGRGMIACVALAIVSGAASPADPLPPALEQVGITQKLDAALPLDLRFRDETGREVRLGDYFDGKRPVLLSLVYYECPMLCTLVLDGMVRTLGELEWTPGRNFRVLTVSIDPHDTPELARQKKASYLAAYGRSEAAGDWSFLTGEQTEITRLADAVGFRYRYLEDSGEFAHPAALFVLTPEGRLSRYLFGVEHEAATVRLSLVEAAEGRIGSPVDQFLLYCYRYDAATGSYAPVARRIMQVGASASAIVLASVLVTLWIRDARRRPGQGKEAA